MIHVVIPGGEMRCLMLGNYCKLTTKPNLCVLNLPEVINMWVFYTNGCHSDLIILDEKTSS